MKKLPFPINSKVVRTTDTSADNPGEVTGYTEDARHVHVRWPGKDQTTLHKVANICTPDDWRAIQRKQSGLRDAWKAGVRR